jgi:pyruvate/2-oxoglutarate dehydrogenase complex dihydrolipoamide dehydrogenase (E3) component
MWGEPDGKPPAGERSERSDSLNSRLEFVGFPYGIYTIPEISMIGKSESELCEAKQPYEVLAIRNFRIVMLLIRAISLQIGVAHYEELAKGQMLGGMPGMLKIIFHPVTLKVLGVHCIGKVCITCAVSNEDCVFVKDALA